MATEIPRERVFGNFKPSKRDQLEAKEAHDPRAEREGNSEKHLALIRELPCCVCSTHPGGQAHHLKATGRRGMGMRSPDRFAVPMCHEHHINGVERVGSKSELDWFRKHNIEALDLAAALWGATGYLPNMMKIVIEHKRGK